MNPHNRNAPHGEEAAVLLADAGPSLGIIASLILAVIRLVSHLTR